MSSKDEIRNVTENHRPLYCTCTVYVHAVALFFALAPLDSRTRKTIKFLSRRPPPFSSVAHPLAHPHSPKKGTSAFCLVIYLKDFFSGHFVFAFSRKMRSYRLLIFTSFYLCYCAGIDLEFPPCEQINTALCSSNRFKSQCPSVCGGGGGGNHIAQNNQNSGNNGNNDNDKSHNVSDKK